MTGVSHEHLAIDGEEETYLGVERVVRVEIARGGRYQRRGRRGG